MRIAPLLVVLTLTGGVAALPFIQVVRARQTAPTLKADRVAKAKALLAEGKVYANGCSGFVCDVLGVDQQTANDMMAGATDVIGDNGNYDYTKLEPGDIVGRIKEPHGHVAVFIAKPVGADKPFIDVKEENGKPRALTSYGQGFELKKCVKY